MSSKREQILAATLDVIHESGLQSCTMAQIIKRANVGSGTLYNYFESKEVLVHTLYTEQKERLNQRCMVNFPTQAIPKERFKHIWNHFIDFAVKNPKEFYFIDAYNHSSYVNFKAQVENSEGPLKMLLELAEEVKRENRSFDMLETPHILILIYGAITSAIKSHILGEFLLNEKLIETTIEYVWEMLDQKA